MDKQFCMIPEFNDSSDGIDSVTPIRVSTDDVDFGNMVADLHLWNAELSIWKNSINTLGT